MYVQSRLVNKSNETIGYVLNDDGLEINTSVRAMYIEDTIMALKDAGYTYVNYDGDIITPEGTNIKDLLSDELDTSDPVEYQMFIDEGDLALTEADALKYFTVQKKDREFHEFRKEESYEINTRKELESYLHVQQRMYKLNRNMVDIRPLNSYVNPEALYTIQELRNPNSDAKYFLSILARVRKLDTYTQYEELIKVLRQSGALTAENPTQAEVLEAYLSWGIPGINAKCYDWSIVANDNTDIASANTALTAPAEVVYGLMNKKGNILFKGVEFELEDCDDLQIHDLKPIDEGVYYKIYNSIRNNSEDGLHPIKCSVENRRDRVHAVIVDENGYEVKFRADIDNIVVRDSSGSLFYIDDMLKVRLYDGSVTSMSNFKTREDYDKYILCRAFAKSMLLEKTIEPKEKSTFEICRTAGLSTYTTLRYAGYRAGTREIAKELGINYDTYECVDIFRKGLPASLLDDFEINQEEIEDLTDLDVIDLVFSKQFQLEEEGNYDIVSAYEKQLEKIKVVSSILKGDINLDNFAEGIKEDVASTLHTIATLVETAVYATVGSKDINTVSLINLLQDSNGKLAFDVNKVVGIRDGKYYGALKDMAVLNSRRVQQSTKLCYITKVFREASNGPVEEQRDYMAEMIVLDNERGTLTDVALNRLIEVINKKIEEDELRAKLPIKLFEVIKERVPEIACKIVFATVLAADNQAISVDKVFPVKLTDDITLDVNIPYAIYNKLSSSGMRNNIKYVTLFDYVQYEISNTNVFCLYCLNATITPWSVTALPGYKSIPRYPFGVNYMTYGDMSMFGENFVNRVKDSGSKVIDLRQVSPDDFLIEFTSNYVDSSDFNLDIAESELPVDDIEEHVSGYNLRFMRTNNKAHEQGKFLEKMMLKADACLSIFAEFDNTTPIEENTFLEAASPKDRFQYLTNYQVLNTNADTNLRISTNGSYLQPFDLNKDFSLISRWSNLLFGKVKSNVITIASVIGLTVMHGEEVNTYKFPLAQGEIQYLVDEGVLYRIGANSFVLESLGNLYKLEV